MNGNVRNRNLVSGDAELDVSSQGRVNGNLVLSYNAMFAWSQICMRAGSRSGTAGLLACALCRMTGNFAADGGRTRSWEAHECKYEW